MLDVSLSDSAFEGTDSLCYLEDFSVREITKLADKIKWTKAFSRGYNAGFRRTSDMYDINVRYFVAILNNKEAGFISIGNRTMMWSDFYDGEVWSASFALVKKPYRNKMILKRLLSYVIENCNVRMAYIEELRYEMNYLYYQSLGFVQVIKTDDPKLVYIIHRDLLEAERKRRADILSMRKISV